MKKRTHPSVLIQESSWVTQFVLNHVVSDAAVRAVRMQDIYDSYCDYLARKEMGPSKLTVDSFGRMFPKVFERKNVSFDGRTYKSVVGVRVKR
jgi:hypothetical protein